MTSEIDEMRASLIAAVQAELERHAGAVVAEVDKLRQASTQEREAMRAAFNEQLVALATAVEQSHAQAEQSHNQLTEQIEARAAESEARSARRIDDVQRGIESLATDAVRPVVATLRDESDDLARRVEALDTNLRKFDEQAARMVAYFTSSTEATETKLDSVTNELRTDVIGRVEAIVQRVEENESLVRKSQSDISQSTSARLAESEDRLNQRLLATETRMKEENGQRIANIDAHVGKVTAGLDDTIAVLNDRLAAQDQRFDELSAELATVEEATKGFDSEAIDELKEKMSTAIGEAMLVRIEMERLEKTVSERTDVIAVRVTEVESQLADATMDVNTAVQLDRLEELERAVIELDPEKFGVDFSVKNASTPVDETGSDTGEAAPTGWPTPTLQPTDGSAPMSQIEEH